MREQSYNKIDKDSPAFEDLRELLEDWAVTYGICLFPAPLAIDAANYIHDELLNARETE